MSARILVSASLLAAVFMACSGATPSDLYDSTGSSQFGNTPTTSNGNGSGNGSGTGSGSGSGSGSGGNGDTGGNGGGGGGNGGGGGGGGGGTVDAGKGGSNDAGQSNDAGFMTSGPGIYCGADMNDQAVFCSTKSQECCGTKNLGDLNFSYACIANGGQCAGVPIHCDDRLDCPSNQVCCGTFDQVKGYLAVECKTTCGGSGGGTTGVRMCDPNAATDECASIGKTCQQSGSLTGFYRCN